MCNVIPSVQKEYDRCASEMKELNDKYDKVIKILSSRKQTTKNKKSLELVTKAKEFSNFLWNHYSTERLNDPAVKASIEYNDEMERQKKEQVIKRFYECENDKVEREYNCEKYFYPAAQQY
jgi:hypothetical protein